MQQTPGPVHCPCYVVSLCSETPVLCYSRILANSGNAQEVLSLLI
jgi:hypothetical protein